MLLPDASDYVALIHEHIDVTALGEWARRPEAGAVVTFSGVVRDYAEGRHDVVALTYEAYEAPAQRAMEAIVSVARDRWPGCTRIALVHRLGRVELSDASVVVVVSAGHRGDAFDAARYCIDTLKESVPIWKQEHWAGGDGWAVDARPLEPLTASDREAG